MIRPFTSARLASAARASYSPLGAHRQISASARYKLTNYTFYATAGFAFAVVAFSTLLPCPVRSSPYAHLQESDVEVQRKMLEQALVQQQQQQAGSRRRRWLEEPIAPAQQERST